MGALIPAHAGIQLPWIPARASYRQLGRNDDPAPFSEPDTPPGLTSGGLLR